MAKAAAATLTKTNKVGAFRHDRAHWQSQRTLGKCSPTTPPLSMPHQTLGGLWSAVESQMLFRLCALQDSAASGCAVGPTRRLSVPLYLSSFSPHVQMFGGLVRRYQHQSEELGCSMNFTVFFPPAAAAGGAKVPVRTAQGRLLLAAR